MTLFRWKKYSCVFEYNLGSFTLLPARRELKKIIFPIFYIKNLFNGGNIIIYYQI